MKLLVHFEGSLFSCRTQLKRKQEPAGSTCLHGDKESPAQPGPRHCMGFYCFHNKLLTVCESEAWVQVVVCSESPNQRPGQMSFLSGGPVG